MSDFVKLMPPGASVQCLTSGSMLFHYGSDGVVFLSPDGFISGDHYAVRKLIALFRRKDVPFTPVGAGLLLCKVLCHHVVPARD